MNNERAPVALFVYNRPDHALQTLKALKNNISATESTLYIFADGPKEGCSEEMLEQIRRTRELLHAEQWCGKVVIKEQAENLGLANSIIAGVSEVINLHGKIIVLEDDMISSPGFLLFMNRALEMYENADNVACISGYIYPVNKLPETFFIKGADCWGWGTWKRAWDSFEKDGSVLLSALTERKLTEEFDFGNSYPYTAMLRDQTEGRNDSWAVRWYASCFLKNMLCLYPGESYIENIGLDGSGTHCITDEQRDRIILNERQTFSKTTCKENGKAKKLISAYLGHQPSPMQKFKKRISNWFS